jgi:hypothetical protein
MPNMECYVAYCKLLQESVLWYNKLWLAKLGERSFVKMVVNQNNHSKRLFLVRSTL